MLTVEQAAREASEAYRKLRQRYPRRVEDEGAFNLAMRRLRAAIVYEDKRDEKRRREMRKAMESNKPTGGEWFRNYKPGCCQ